jgi:hypothetical protein
MTSESQKGSPLLNIEIEYVEAAVEELQDYLVSSDLYGVISGLNNPTNAETFRLTPGNILLSFRKIFANKRSVHYANDYICYQNFDRIRNKWHVAWTTKMERELINRMQIWDNYLKEISLGERSDAVYRFQVRNRTIVEIISSEINNNKHNQAISRLDEILISFSNIGPFVWESEIMNGFSTNQFWFLYRSIIKS